MGSGYRTGADFLLINLLLLVLTQPGALVLAGFDPPFGLAVNATMWMAAFVGASPLAVLYLLIRSEALGRRFLPAAAAYIALVLAVAYASYLMQQPLFEGFRAPGYCQWRCKIPHFRRDKIPHPITFFHFANPFQKYHLIIS
ncbi:MAG: Uncharacterized protein XE10_1449 [Methanoculleus marisnigri]|jgi:hypothetical protein|uniref:Uncharacterized protein n=1 Tax=Methanoculleus marisnigri TaxID=2198 RepID=A0A124FS82_9EURY|nr:hypothetical protein [Methanoculleus marisnigri]KUK61447.1 MAG: Uncharacterized protein XD82_1108 [Methanoculleus marisnigri]KUL00347.1 MAG: Uncharacterized protein XE10_1449 [Methanoculleus marisnigri]